MQFRNETPNRIGMQPLTVINTAIIAINVIVFILLEVLGDTQDAHFMYEHGARIPVPLGEASEWYRMITSMFMHFGMAHLLNNMLVLYYVGDNLERAVGKVRYLIIYLGSGVLGSIVSNEWVLQVTKDGAVSAGASGAIFGVLGALLIIVARNRGKLEDITMKRLVICVALTLYSGFTSSGVDNAAHLGGLFAGMLLALVVGQKRRKGARKF